MRKALFVSGDRVRIKKAVKDHGGKTGVVQALGKRFGYTIVSVRVDEFPSAVDFSPEEIENVP
jgi:hypothetical protein